MPIQEFEPIECTLPNVDEKDLRSIQKYLLKVVRAIKTDECSLDLSNSEPGTLNHARWLTCANRILRLYMATVQPFGNLIVVVSFLFKVDVPMWF